MTAAAYPTKSVNHTNPDPLTSQPRGSLDLSLLDIPILTDIVTVDPQPQQSSN